MHISKNDLHCREPARLLQWAPSSLRTGPKEAIMAIPYTGLFIAASCIFTVWSQSVHPVVRNGFKYRTTGTEL
jgi:hypothetical protein